MREHIHDEFVLRPSFNLRGEDGGRLQREEERRRVGVRFARVSRQRRRRGGKKFDGGEDEGKFKKVIINVDAAV